MFSHLILYKYLDAKHDGDDDDNMNVSMNQNEKGNGDDQKSKTEKDDAADQKSENGAKRDAEKGEKKPAKNPENESQEKDDGGKRMSKLTLCSKKRKSGVEKSLELVFDKFKQANSEDFERYHLCLFNIEMIVELGFLKTQHQKKQNLTCFKYTNFMMCLLFLLK